MVFAGRQSCQVTVTVLQCTIIPDSPPFVFSKQHRADINCSSELASVLDFPPDPYKLLQNDARTVHVGEIFTAKVEPSTFKKGLTEICNKETCVMICLQICQKNAQCSFKAVGEMSSERKVFRHFASVRWTLDLGAVTTSSEPIRCLPLRRHCTCILTRRTNNAAGCSGGTLVLRESVIFISLPCWSWLSALVTMRIWMTRETGINGHGDNSNDFLSHHRGSLSRLFRLFSGVLFSKTCLIVAVKDIANGPGSSYLNPLLGLGASHCVLVYVHGGN